MVGLRCTAGRSCPMSHEEETTTKERRTHTFPKLSATRRKKLQLLAERNGVLQVAVAAGVAHHCVRRVLKNEGGLRASTLAKLSAYIDAAESAGEASVPQAIPTDVLRRPASAVNGEQATITIRLVLPPG